MSTSGWYWKISQIVICGPKSILQDDWLWKSLGARAVDYHGRFLSDLGNLYTVRIQLRWGVMEISQIGVMGHFSKLSGW
jgi:hypothetical protein